MKKKHTHTHQKSVNRRSPRNLPYFERRVSILYERPSVDLTRYRRSVTKIATISVTYNRSKHVVRARVQHFFRNARMNQTRIRRRKTRACA